MLRWRNIELPNASYCCRGDPISGGAQTLYDVLASLKTLIKFRLAEGSGGHCEALSRALYH
jgi:hypothetical protein